MAKSELKVDTHVITREHQAVEVWYDGKFIAAVYGADGPGVRIISKLPMNVVSEGTDELIKVVELNMEPT